MYICWFHYISLSTRLPNMESASTQTLTHSWSCVMPHGSYIWRSSAANLYGHDIQLRCEQWKRHKKDNTRAVSYNNTLCIAVFAIFTFQWSIRNRPWSNKKISRTQRWKCDHLLSDGWAATSTDKRDVLKRGKCSRKKARALVSNNEITTHLTAIGCS